MPWYINPTATRKVVNRIAARYSQASLQDLQSALDRATQSLWKKQEFYYKHIEQGREAAKP